MPFKLNQYLTIPEQVNRELSSGIPKAVAEERIARLIEHEAELERIREANKPLTAWGKTKLEKLLAEHEGAFQAAETARRAEELRKINEAKAAREASERAKVAAAPPRPALREIDPTPRPQTITERSCPVCRRSVALINGQLPREHKFVERDPQTHQLETRVCLPYGTEEPPRIQPRVEIATPDFSAMQKRMPTWRYPS